MPKLHDNSVKTENILLLDSLFNYLGEDLGRS